MSIVGIIGDVMAVTDDVIVDPPPRNDVKSRPIDVMLGDDVLQWDESNGAAIALTVTMGNAKETGVMRWLLH